MYTFYDEKEKRPVSEKNVIQSKDKGNGKTTCYYHCDNDGLSKVKFHVFSNKNENGEPYTLLRNKRGRALLDKEKRIDNKFDVAGITHIWLRMINKEINKWEYGTFPLTLVVT